MNRVLLTCLALALAVLASPSRAATVMACQDIDGSSWPASPQHPCPTTGASDVAQGSATAGQSGSLAQGAVTTSVPVYTAGQTQPLNMSPAGGLRTVLYTASGNPVTQGFSTGAIAGAAGLGVSGIYLSTLPALTNSQSVGITMTPQAALRTTRSGGLSILNITAATTVKGTPGRISKVCLNTAASTASSVIDSAGTSATAANTILTIPSTAVAGTCFDLDWVTSVGIGIVPGTSGVLAVSYE